MVRPFLAPCVYFLNKYLIPTLGIMGIVPLGIVPLGLWGSVGAGRVAHGRSLPPWMRDLEFRLLP